MDISEDEWEMIKTRNNYRCLNCGKSERQVGVLLKTFLQDAATGGTRVLPLCMSCQNRFKAGRLEQFELQRLHITPEEYDIVIPDVARRGTYSIRPPRSGGIP